MNKRFFDAGLLSGSPKTRSSYLVALTVTVCLFVLYNLNFRATHSVDVLGSTLLPVSILKEGNLDLNEFETLFIDNPKPWQAGFVFGSIQESMIEEEPGKIISSYPVGSALIALPIYGVAMISGKLDDRSWRSLRLTGKVASSFIVASAAGLLYLLLTGFLSPTPALILSLAFGLGTSAWPVASQGMWQHGPGILSLVVGLYALVRLQEEEKGRWAAIAGVAFTFAVLCRALNAIPAILFSLYFLSAHRNLAVHFFPVPIIGAIWLIRYNLSNYDTFTGGYAAILDSDWHQSKGLSTTTLFTNPLAKGLASVLVSPSKGILIYSPFFLFAFISVFYWRSVGSMLKWPVGLWLLMVTISLSKNALWWGGSSYGPRYFGEVSIAAVLLIALIWPVLPRIMSSLLLVSIGVSIVIQTMGAFYAPCGWADTPAWADFHPERYWDWRDPEIIRCARIGFEQGPLDFEFLKPPPVGSVN